MTIENIESAPDQSKVSDEIVAVSPETEQLPRQSNRIVVYGSRGSGANDLSHKIQDVLTSHGIPEHEGRLDYTRWVDRIEDTFFARANPPAPEFVQPAPGLASEQVAARGLIRRIAATFRFRSHSREIDKPVAPQLVAAEQMVADPFQDTRPRGVIIFSTMRDHDPLSASNMNVSRDGFAGSITQLCEENQVQYLFADDHTGLDQAIGALLDQNPVRKIEASSL